jgi:hypothetical protein
MKKLLFLSIFCLCVSTASLAWQAVNTPVVLPAEDLLQGVNVEEERARIKTAREAALETYKKEVKNCYQQVVVSSCKMDAQQKKIEIDNDLRRQEVLLNNYQRQLRGDKALQRLDEKQSVDKQIEAEEKRIDYHNGHLEKLQENLDKNEKYLQQQEEIEANREKYEQRMQEIRERQRKQQEKAAAIEKKRADYQRKLDEADKHRQQVEADSATRKPSTDALPKPRPEDMPK